MGSSKLLSERCAPCESGGSPLPGAEAESLLRELSGWQFTSDHKAIFIALRMKDFLAALRLMQRIAEVAEEQDHHPDLHLTGYRNLRIELSTHSVGGLSRNDFILAARIDQLPRELKA
jgi:4a-hydroxytetrahydrobiopterin dehydratase